MYVRLRSSDCCSGLLFFHVHKKFALKINEENWIGGGEGKWNKKLQRTNINNQKVGNY